MSMAGYTKLFNSILASTIWRSKKETKILWITMLAMADKEGMVESSIPGLADIARLSIPEIEIALKELQAPDSYSRTKDNQGRRILAVDGGWQILNHAKYRAKMGADERREYLRIKQAEFRARKQAVNKSGDKSTQSTHTEADTDTEAKAEAIHLSRVPGTSTALSVEACAKQDAIDNDIAFEERRFTELALPIRDSIQSVLDSLPRPASRNPFSASRWLKTGLTGIGRSEGALTVLRLTNDALEARQRAQEAPILSENNRKSFDAIDRVTARLKARRDGTPIPREIEG